MDRPTNDEVRARSELLRTDLPAPGGDAALTALIEDASALISAMTCRDIGAGTGEDVPAALLPVARRAVTLKSEALYVSGTPTARRGAIGGGRLQSISAGPWSESYFGPGEAAQAGVLDPDPALHEALWALATEECRQEWLLLWAALRGDLDAPPASAVEEVDWLPGARRSSVLGEDTWGDW